MRLVHLVVALAVAVVVAVLLYAFREKDDAPRRDRAAEGPAVPPARAPDADPEQPAATGLTVTALLELPGGAPAADAVVELIGPIARSARAEESGALRLDGLAAGPYTLVARSGDAALSHAFELAATRDLGTLRLTTAVLVRGHVRDTTGRKIAGAAVEAFADELDGGTWAWLVRRPDAVQPVAARTRTGPDGAYVLALPGAGGYRLSASAPGFATAAAAAAPYERARDGVDFFLVPGVAVTGHVRAANDTPVPSARVVLTTWSLAGTRRETAFTDADGRFAFALAPRSRAQFTVVAAGFAVFTSSTLPIPSPPLEFVLEPGVEVRVRAVAKESGAPAAGVRVVLQYHGGHAEGETDERGEVVFAGQPARPSPSGRDDVYFVAGPYAPRRLSLRGREPQAGVLDLGDVALAPGGVVTGFVRHADDRRPVAGAKVVVFTSDWMAAAMANPTARTDARGAFRLEGVPLGAAVLAASHPEFVQPSSPRELFSLLRRDGESLFPDGARTAETEILLLAAATVTGQVLDPDGEAVDGARVSVIGARDPFAGILDRGPQIAVTDASGGFELTGLHPDHAVMLVADHAAFGASEPVPVTPRARVAPTLTLRAPRLVRGRVVDESEAPVAGATVRVRAGRTAGASASAVTGGDGAFVVRNAPAGELTLTVDHDAYRPLSTTVADDDAGTLTLVRGARIAGVVVDAAGRPLAGVSVGLFHTESRRARTLQRRWVERVTDAEGRFEAAGLEDGSYRVKPRRVGWFGAQREVPVDTTDVRLVMRRVATLAGRVVAEGRPVAGATITAVVPPSEPVESTRTGLDGRFRLERLPPERDVTLRVRHAAYDALEIPGVRASPASREIVLTPGVRVGGRVVDVEGAPVAGVSLTVVSEDGRRRGARTGKNGTFVVGGLGAGRLELQVRWAPDRYVRPPPRAVEAGDRDVTVTLREGLAIAGKVLDRAGNPAGVVIVQAVRDGKVARQTFVAAGTGTFRIAGLPEGRYTVRVLRGTRADDPLATTPDIPAGTTNVVLRLP